MLDYKEFILYTIENRIVAQGNFLAFFYEYIKGPLEKNLKIHYHYKIKLIKASND
jgi:hypothetical protein